MIFNISKFSAIFHLNPLNKINKIKSYVSLVLSFSSITFYNYFHSISFHFFFPGEWQGLLERNILYALFSCAGFLFDHFQKDP